MPKRLEIEMSLGICFTRLVARVPQLAMALDDEFRFGVHEVWPSNEESLMITDFELHTGCRELAFE